MLVNRWKVHLVVSQTQYMKNHSQHRYVHRLDLALPSFLLIEASPGHVCNNALHIRNHRIHSKKPKYPIFSPTASQYA